MGAPVATNKKARRDFDIQETWECGLVLQGSEVKSVRAGYVSFKNSFARVDEEELFLFNLQIEPYAQASYMNPKDPDRPRKLLIHKRELKKLAATMAQKGLALVPLDVYFNDRGYLKVRIGLGRGKKMFDKREDIKKREVNRDLDRRMKRYTR